MSAFYREMMMMDKFFEELDAMRPNFNGDQGFDQSGLKGKVTH
jgi:hypothetical protein